MQKDQEPSSRGRWVAKFLCEAMERRGWKGRDMANALGWSESRVSRTLSGKRLASDVDLTIFLAFCGVGAAELEFVLRVARADRTLWPVDQSCRVPPGQAADIDHHARADRITEFATTVLPIMLQTEGYARALADATVPWDPEHQLEQNVARRHLMAPLDRDFPPACGFFVHEWLVRTPVGGDSAMADQLHHLLRISTRRYVSIRVVPIAAGAHAGQAGPFTLIEVDGSRAVVALTQERATVFVEDPTEVASYRDITRLLATAALDEQQSRDLIARVAVECFDADPLPG